MIGTETSNENQGGSKVVRGLNGSGSRAVAVLRGLPRALVWLIAAGLVPVAACGEMDDETGEASSPIIEVTARDSRPDPGPCMACRDHAQEIAAAAAQAERLAMQEAEARARELRRLSEAKIAACVATKNADLRACNSSLEAGARMAAIARTNCNARPVCTGSTSAALRAACIQQGGVLCTDHLNSCLARIPVGAPGIDAGIIGRAIAACNGEFGAFPCRDTIVRLACSGTGNFNGFGSTQALCRDYLQSNCAEPEAAAIAAAQQGLASCLTVAFFKESVCLGHPTMVTM